MADEELQPTTTHLDEEELEEALATEEPTADAGEPAKEPEKPAEPEPGAGYSEYEGPPITGLEDEEPEAEPAEPKEDETKEPPGTADEPATESPAPATAPPSELEQLRWRNRQLERALLTRVTPGAGMQPPAGYAPPPMESGAVPGAPAAEQAPSPPALSPAEIAARIGTDPDDPVVKLLAAQQQQNIALQGQVAEVTGRLQAEDADYRQENFYANTVWPAFVGDPTLVPANEAPLVYQLYSELRDIISDRRMGFPEAYLIWKGTNPDAYTRLKEQAATGATPEERRAAEVDQATRTGFTAATQRQKKNALANQTTAAAAKTTRLEKPLLDLDGALDAAGLGP